MTSGNKRTYGVTTYFKGGLVFIMVALVLLMQFMPASFAQTSSDLVVPAGGTLEITGPEFSVKGSVIILAGGTLRLNNTLFTIYQDLDRQFEFKVEKGGTIHLEDSEIRATKPLDIILEEDSQLILERSEIHIPGKLYGDPGLFDLDESTVDVATFDFFADELRVKTSMMYSDDCAISTDYGIFEDSVLFSPHTIVKRSCCCNRFYFDTLRKSSHIGKESGRIT